MHKLIYCTLKSYYAELTEGKGMVSYLVAISKCRFVVVAAYPTFIV